MTPGTLPLVAQRNAPFFYSIEFVGYDFSAATLAAQVRQYRGQTGTALLPLTKQTAGTQGISVTVVTTLGVPTSTLLYQIDEANIDACLPFPANGQKAGTDVELVHDLIITGGGLNKTRMLEGPFIIREGATV